jgi:hypothetical protein
MANPERIAGLDQAKERLRAARVRTEQCRERTDKLIASAIALLGKYDQLEQRAKRKFDNQVLGPAPKSSNHDGVGMLPAMKQALANVESVVMVPQDDESASEAEV